MRTDAWENWEANNTEFVQGLKDKMPLGFLGDPEEHGAPWIVWLAGKGGEYVTDMTIMLNGGRDMALVARGRSAHRAGEADAPASDERPELEVLVDPSCARRVLQPAPSSGSESGLNAKPTGVTIPVVAKYPRSTPLGENFRIVPSPRFET